MAMTYIGNIADTPGYAPRRAPSTLGHFVAPPATSVGSVGSLVPNHIEHEVAIADKTITQIREIAAANLQRVFWLALGVLGLILFALWVAGVFDGSPKKRRRKKHRLTG
jgi:hypothetical protein